MARRKTRLSSPSGWIVKKLGVRCRVLFQRRGYTPHYAEHVRDPVSGREVLVMADPHMRGSVIIHDPQRDEIIWEFRVPGDQVANPHIARLIEERVRPISAEPGDIICADSDNRYIVVDRSSKSVKWSFRPSDAAWSHDALPTSDVDGLLLTDYSAGFVRRVDLKGEVKWNIRIGKGAAKLSRVAGETKSGIHSNSFGGDVLLAVNQSTRGVYELREGDGAVVWECPPPRGSRNVFFTLKPHSAVRIGLAELGGNLTVIGHEAGGGIVAVDRECRPRWGAMKPLTLSEGGEIYRPMSRGLFETTHVFTTTRGTVGAIDWDGSDSSTVFELLEAPRASRLYWLLAWEREAGTEAEFLDPPIETAEWGETLLELTNHGEGVVEWRVHATLSSYVDVRSSRFWRVVHSSTVRPGECDEFLAERYAAVRVAVSSPMGGARYSVLVSQAP